MISQGARAMTVGRNSFLGSRMGIGLSDVIVRSRLSPGLRSFSELVAIRRIAGLGEQRTLQAGAGGRARGRIFLKEGGSVSRCFASPASSPRRKAPRGVGDGPNFLGRCFRSRCRSHLFLEATQRNTVRTVFNMLRMEPRRAESQVGGIAPRSGRRPTVSVGADAEYFTVVAVAIARGRCRWARPQGVLQA